MAARTGDERRWPGNFSRIADRIKNGTRDADVNVGGNVNCDHRASSRKRDIRAERKFSILGIRGQRTRARSSRWSSGDQRNIRRRGVQR